MPRGAAAGQRCTDAAARAWIERYRPGFIKVEVGALPAAEIGEVLVKLKTAGYQVGLYAEDVWAFA